MNSYNIGSYVKLFFQQTAKSIMYFLSFVF